MNKMDCRKIEKLLPLYIGGELNKRKIEKIKKHLSKCKSCEESYKLYLKTMKKIKEIAEKDIISDFNEIEWKVFKNRLYKVETLKTIYTYNWKKAIATALILIGIITGGFYFYSNYFHRKFEEQKKELPKVSETIKFDKLKVSFILKETNTRVIWYFDKNFNLGGENEL
ncbi:zf-HC2 domain-containing protein [SCandidatus Aminicenantes bacterium Aminicenantia_JdfR_composite]|jgi:predicted anti-sigma-YlaC factor YlaD|nr:zf-HC2 domain-containing protein [SCandidatus Aminicenantes bacterium Aminicenantia_JdfR_composite]MCP2596849.1 zf-HC2 domain-containing protein [Candidatus Aminicenantes bacterium AC-335-G13]MCP2605539.1 zf-HC2 domain-containing protein [Candidatus Aminicenantes bacterium AC-335-O07]